jgi:predicted dehydrogenase
MLWQLKVGIIGASADRGWAKISHVPAVQQPCGFGAVGVASGSQATSEAAAKAFGAKAAYDDARELFRDPIIDIVSMYVKVPDHRELVLGALSSVKHIYCEWPFGRDLVESEELAAAAQVAGVPCGDWRPGALESPPWNSAGTALVSRRPTSRRTTE